MQNEGELEKEEINDDFLEKVKGLRKIFFFKKNENQKEKEKIVKKKFNNKEARDDMNIFQCPFPDCKRNYFNLKDWGVHYRYHVYKKIKIYISDFIIIYKIFILLKGQ
jgi:hypothetical protein